MSSKSSQALSPLKKTNATSQMRIQLKFLKENNMFGKDSEFVQEGGEKYANLTAIKNRIKTIVMSGIQIPPEFTNIIDKYFTTDLGVKQQLLEQLNNVNFKNWEKNQNYEVIYDGSQPSITSQEITESKKPEPTTMAEEEELPTKKSVPKPILKKVTKEEEKELEKTIETMTVSEPPAQESTIETILSVPNPVRELYITSQSQIDYDSINAIEQHFVDLDTLENTLRNSTGANEAVINELNARIEDVSRRIRNQIEYGIRRKIEKKELPAQGTGFDAELDLKINELKQAEVDLQIQAENDDLKEKADATGLPPTIKESTYVTNESSNLTGATGADTATAVKERLVEEHKILSKEVKGKINSLEAFSALPEAPTAPISVEQKTTPTSTVQPTQMISEVQPQSTTTLPMVKSAHSPKYHINSIKLYFDQDPDWDTELENNVYSTEWTAQERVQMMDSIIAKYGTDIMVFSRKSDTVDELHELLQLMFCRMRNMQRGSRTPMAVMPVSQLVQWYMKMLPTQAPAQMSTGVDISAQATGMSQTIQSKIPDANAQISKEAVKLAQNKAYNNLVDAIQEKKFDRFGKRILNANLINELSGHKFSNTVGHYAMADPMNQYTPNVAMPIKKEPKKKTISM